MMNKIVFGGLLVVGALAGSASAEATATATGVTVDSENSSGQQERRVESQVANDLPSEQQGRRKTQGGQPSKTGRNFSPDYVDDYFGVDDYYYYDDYFYGDDYYYYGKGKGKGGKKSKKSSKKGKGKGDIFGDDDFFIGNPRPTIAVAGEAFSPSSFGPVFADSSVQDEFAQGTVYPFGNFTLNAEDVSSDFIDITIEGTHTQVFVELNGYCTRTGFSTDTVEGYCHFSYSLFDPLSNSVPIGIFVAEGPLTNPNLSFNPCASLQVTGGTGIFTAANGIVAFCPAVVDALGMVESLPLGQDLFEDVDGYLHLIDLVLDQEFAILIAPF